MLSKIQAEMSSRYPGIYTDNTITSDQLTVNSQKYHEGNSWYVGYGITVDKRHNIEIGRVKLASEDDPWRGDISHITPSIGFNIGQVMAVSALVTELDNKKSNGSLS